MFLKKEEADILRNVVNRDEEFTIISIQGSNLNVREGVNKTLILSTFEQNNRPMIP